MIKALIALLLALPLVSFAPVRPVVYYASVAIVQSAQPPGCTWETAPARLSQRVYDPIGYPFGEVASWSCDGDTQAVIADLHARVTAMQAQAEAYRAEHPIAR